MAGATGEGYVKLAVQNFSICSVTITIEMIRVQRYKYTRFPTTGYARALKFMFIRRELGGTGTGCLFQFTYCV